MFKILCSVRGGVTGSRSAFLKHNDGEEQVFETEAEAREKAEKLYASVKGLNTSAVFNYVVTQIN